MIQVIKKLSVAMLGVALICGGIAVRAQSDTTAKSPAVLTSADATKILPPSVFFQGQSASIQARNSGGVRFSDGKYVLVALVDASGYSSSVQQKYQSYLITEVPLEFDGHQLPVGAYGCGFRANNQFVIMDLSGKDIITAQATHDEALHRPTPLKVVAGDKAGSYRIYQGREAVTFSRAEGSAN